MKQEKIPPRPAAGRATRSPRNPVRISKPRRAPPDDSILMGSLPDFVPASPRERHDGWTPDKQVAFIDALAETGCVTEACERVGQSPSTAYRLRRRPDAYSFRAAWDAALDHAIRRLSDAAFSRALNGVARPVFFQGEQVGERRYYDERLTMFLLRYRDPESYGAWRDRREPRRRPDAQAIALGRWTNHVAEDAWDTDAGMTVDREREEDATEWLTDEEAALADRAIMAIRPATQEQTDARLLACVAVLQRVKGLGIDPCALSDAEFNRLADAEQLRRAATAASPGPDGEPPAKGDESGGT